MEAFQVQARLAERANEQQHIGGEEDAAVGMTDGLGPSESAIDRSSGFLTLKTRHAAGTLAVNRNVLQRPPEAVTTRNRENGSPAVGKHNTVRMVL